MIFGRNESDGAEASSLPSILLVDDEPEILPEYQEFLELKGYDAAISSDPEEAYQMVLAQPEIALVVTDLKMARLDGVGLIRKLRATLPPERHLEFIILTGDATSQISEDIAGIWVCRSAMASSAIWVARSTAKTPETARGSLSNCHWQTTCLRSCEFRAFAHFLNHHPNA